MSQFSPHSEPAARPSRVRYWVVGSAALMAVLLYLDRICISFAEIFIKEDLGLTDDQISWVLSAFFWTYALGQVPSGWLTDRFGSRTMLTLYILVWSLFTFLTGIATGFVMLLAVRFGFGLGQAGAYPTSASVLSKWVPFAGRGAASSLVAVGGRVGGALAPLLTGALILMLVPASSSSQLESRDLLDAPRLCYELSHGKYSAKDSKKASANSSEIKLITSDKHPTNGISEKIAAQLSEDCRLIVQRGSELFATSEKDRLTAEKEKKQPKTLPNVQVALTEEESNILITALNAIISRRDFFNADEVQELSLEKEGRKFLRKQRDTLSDKQAQRLNRLVLEAAYRESVRKVYGSGWRPVMLSFGLCGLLVAALFWFCSRNTPREHPRCNKEEIALIEEGRPPSAQTTHGKVGGVPIRRILLSPSLWLSSISQWFTNVGWIFIISWFPRYLENEFQVPVAQRLWMAFIPLTVGWFGMIGGGRLTDWLVGRVGLRWGRALPMSLSRFVAMSAYLVCLLPLPSPWVAVAMMSVVTFSTDLGTSASWAFTQDVGGKHVGSILGWGNMWGNLGAAVAIRFLLWIVGDDYHWNAAFLTCAIAFLCSGIAAAGINATVPIVPEEDTNSDDDEVSNQS